jgi:NADH-quinone oxidoreductase subunit L
MSLIGGLVVFSGVGETLGFPGGFGEFVFSEEPEAFDFAIDIAILSTILAGGGVIVGYIFWSGDAAPATRMGEMFRPVYQLLFNRFYIDAFYQWVINNIVLSLGKTIAWFDRNIVNDTGIDGSGGLAVFTGYGLKFLESGKLPNYALAIAVGAIIIAIAFLVLVI